MTCSAPVASVAFGGVSSVTRRRAVGPSAVPTSKNVGLPCWLMVASVAHGVPRLVASSAVAGMTFPCAALNKGCPSGIVGLLRSESYNGQLQRQCLGYPQAASHEEPQQRAIGVWPQRTWRAECAGRLQEPADHIGREDVGASPLRGHPEHATWGDLVPAVFGGHVTREADQDPQAAVALGEGRRPRGLRGGGGAADVRVAAVGGEPREVAQQVVRIRSTKRVTDRAGMIRYVVSSGCTRSRASVAMRKGLAASRS